MCHSGNGNRLVSQSLTADPGVILNVPPSCTPLLYETNASKKSKCGKTPVGLSKNQRPSSSNGDFFFFNLRKQSVRGWLNTYWSRVVERWFHTPRIDSSCFSYSSLEGKSLENSIICIFLHISPFFFRCGKKVINSTQDVFLKWFIFILMIIC